MRHKIPYTFVTLILIQNLCFALGGLRLNARATSLNKSNKHFDLNIGRKVSGDFARHFQPDETESKESQATLQPNPDTSLALDLSQPLKLVWSYQSDDVSALASVADEQALYVPLVGGKLLALRARDGERLWRTEIGGELTASPASDERAVYCASFAPSNPPAKAAEAAAVTSTAASLSSATLLRALSNRSGLTLWSQTLAEPANFLFATNRVLIAVSASGLISIYDKTVGTLLLSHKMNAVNISDALVTNQELLIAADDSVYSLAFNSNRAPQLLWQIPNAKLSHLAASGNGGVGGGGGGDARIYVAAADGRVLMYDRQLRNQAWQFRVDAEIQSLSITGNRLIVASLNNYIYGYSVSRGSRLWKRRLAGRAATVHPVANSESILFAPLAGEFCVVLDVASGRVQNLLPVGADNNSAAGAAINSNTLFLITRDGIKAFGK